MTQEELKRAARALDANPLLSNCFDKAIANCFSAWQSSKTADEREVLWARVKAIQLVRNEVYAAVKFALRDEQQSKSDS